MGVLADINDTHLLSEASGISRSATLVVAASGASAKFKAQSDYVCDGTADDVQIQAAIDGLPTGGGRVILSEGTFSLSAVVTGVTGLWLSGQGMGATVLTAIGNATIISFTSKTDVTVSDLTLDGDQGTGQTSTGDGVYCISCTRVTIFNVEAEDTYNHGVNIITSTSANVTGCTITSNGVQGIRIDDTDHFVVVDNICTANGARGDPDGQGIEITSTTGVSDQGTVSANVCNDNAGAGIELFDGVTRVSVTGNICDGNGVSPGPGTGPGINVNVTTPTPVQRCVIGGNILTNNGGTGLMVDGCNNLSAANNYAHANGVHGIYIRASDRCVLTGNTCEENEEHGIRVFRGSNVSLIGNICQDNDNGDSGRDGIRIDGDGTTNSDDCIIMGNQCLDTQGTATQDYGIRTTGTTDCNRTLITGNNVSGNDTAGIAAGGASEVVRDNVGWVTENWGTGTLLNGQTTITVAHGLAATPTAVFFSYAEDPATAIAAGDHWIDTLGATNFVFNGPDPGATNLDFYWNAVVR